VVARVEANEGETPFVVVHGSARRRGQGDTQLAPAQAAE
jgi:iron complex transport system ATP-binding protein